MGPGPVEHRTPLKIIIDTAGRSNIELRDFSADRGASHKHRGGARSFLSSVVRTRSTHTLSATI